MIFDISFVCHFTVIFWYIDFENLTRWYYRDTILILSNDCWYIFRMPFRSDILILSWYFDISKYQINSEILLLVSWYFTVIFWYFHDILIHQNIKLTVRFCWYYHDIWYKNHNHHKCVLPRSLSACCMILVL